MTQTILTAGDLSNGTNLLSGNDGTVVIQTGPAGAKVNALSFAATGAATVGAGLAVTGALSSTGSATAGSGTGNVTIIANGANSGSIGGAYVGAQNAGVTVAAIGNTSALLGGSYDATAMIYGSSAIRFAPAGNTQATLDTSGNLGVGITPSAWSGGGLKSLEIATSGFGLACNGASTYLNAGTYFNSGFKYGISGSAICQYLTSAGVHSWYTAPSGTAGNAVSFTQVLGVGQGTTVILQGATSTAGTGIAFPATQLASTDPNTLDDYKEGTWTPSFTALTVVNGTGGVTYSGTYTKIGRLVKWRVLITVTGTATTASSQGITVIGNLPFTAASQDVCMVSTTSQSIGIGAVAGASTTVFTPAWSALNANIAISGNFEV